MRQAAEKAGLIRLGGGGKNNKVMFISEGEASLNTCIEHDLLNGSIRVCWLRFSSSTRDC
jgi:hypothetical protein